MLLSFLKILQYICVIYQTKEYLLHIYMSFSFFIHLINAMIVYKRRYDQVAAIYSGCEVFSGMFKSGSITNVNSLRKKVHEVVFINTK